MILVEGPANIYFGPSFCVNYTDTNENTGWSAMVTATNSFLGRTENGVQVTTNNSLEPVYVDDNGGTEGDPVEQIIKNTSATIKAVIVDFGETSSSSTQWQAVVSKLESGFHSSTNPTIGTPVFGTNVGFALKIVGPTGVATVFPRCSLTDAPRQFNLSSSHKKLGLTFTAYPVTGHTVSTSGVYSVAYNYIWHKQSDAYTTTPCFDSVGGYNTNATSNGQYNN